LVAKLLRIARLEEWVENWEKKLLVSKEIGLKCGWYVEFTQNYFLFVSERQISYEKDNFIHKFRKKYAISRVYGIVHPPDFIVSSFCSQQDASKCQEQVEWLLTLVW
jgi:hypothetical protein